MYLRSPKSLQGTTRIFRMDSVVFLDHHRVIFLIFGLLELCGWLWKSGGFSDGLLAVIGAYFNMDFGSENCP